LTGLSGYIPLDLHVFPSKEVGAGFSYRNFRSILIGVLSYPFLLKAVLGKKEEGLKQKRGQA